MAPTLCKSLVASGKCTGGSLVSLKSWHWMVFWLLQARCSLHWFSLAELPRCREGRGRINTHITELTLTDLAVMRCGAQPAAPLCRSHANIELTATTAAWTRPVHSDLVKWWLCQTDSIRLQQTAPAYGQKRQRSPTSGISWTRVKHSRFMFLALNFVHAARYHARQSGGPLPRLAIDPILATVVFIKEEILSRKMRKMGLCKKKHSLIILISAPEQVKMKRESARSKTNHDGVERQKPGKWDSSSFWMQWTEQEIKAIYQRRPQCSTSEFHQKPSLTAKTTQLFFFSFQ